MKPIKLSLCGALLAAAVLSACSSMPPYERPALAMPASFAGAAGWTPAAPADGEARGPWWTVYGDAVLNGLEERVDVSSQTVIKAVAQLQAARALSDLQHGGLFPTVTANVSSQPYRTSANKAGSSLAGHTVPDHSLGLGASWEPDLFGRIHALAAGAEAGAQASAADLGSVRLSVQTDLAVDYFNLRSLDNQKRLLERTVAADEKALAILTEQLRNGAIDASAQAQAQTQLESARAQALDIVAERAVLQHAIATLVGQPAPTFVLAPGSLRGEPPAIPVDLPSQLLERRPDVAAAERRVAAANAGIGVARAAFYPDLQLTASAGLESTHLSPWLSAPSLFWAVGPALSATLFDGGQRQAQLGNARAQYDAAVADYRQAVLVALQQVEDNLSDLALLAEEQGHQDLATSAAARSLALSGNRFEAGAVSYLEVATAQTIALQNQRLDEQLAARRMAASVLLVKSLGGGWRGLPAQ